MMVCYTYTLSRLLGSAHVTCGKQRVDQENAQAAWLLQCDPEEAVSPTGNGKNTPFSRGENVFFHHGMA